MSSRSTSGRGSDSNTVKVVARVRPATATDLVGGAAAGECVALPAPNQVEVRTAEDKERHVFEFDAVYGPDSRQSEVFDFTGREIVEDVFKGYNGTIFVYGQTGAGKTFTMMGPSLGGLIGYCDDPELKGIIPRAVEAIFASVDAADEALEFTLKVSYVEIYMERVRDLLDPKKVNLQLHEDFQSGRGVYVVDATEAYVSDAEEVFRLMQTGASNRTVAATRMNEESSRSHSILQITVTQKHIVKLEQKSGKLFLVDLAGSERAGKTKAEGLQLEEAKLINKSLSTLGMVINALTDKRSTHIPYRDSKLTRLLQDSVGGNSRTTLIVCCSPSRTQDHETLSTLRFGERAKRIRNRAKINREWTVAELKTLLAKADREISQLKKTRGGDLPGEGLREVPDWLGLEAEWHEERARWQAEREDLLQQLSEAREALFQSQFSLTALHRDVQGLREMDALWADEYVALNRRFVGVSLGYDGEREANAEKTRAIEGLLRQSEETAAALHTARAQAAKLRQQVEQLLLPDAWAVHEGGSNGGHSVDPSNGAESEAPGLQQELQRLKLENDVLQAALALTQEGAEVAAEGEEEEEGPNDSPAPPDQLVQELQAKHAAVLDLEAGLEEAREAYNKVLYAASNRALKKRLLFLEQQAEQQTEAFQAVYSENSTLRLELQLAEKKLAIRNERIENLKAGLKEEKRHLKELQEQFAGEREKFKAELARYKEELNYWKTKSLSRESSAALLGRKGTKNVVKVLKGGQRHGSLTDSLGPPVDSPFAPEEPHGGAPDPPRESPG